MDSTSTITVDLAAIGRNVRRLRRLIGPDTALCTVLKADAYGLGAARIWPAMVEHDVDMVAVYSLPQANELADAGCTARMLVLMPVHRIDPEDAARPQFIAGQVHLTIHDVEQARELVASIRGAGLRLRVPVHIEVDTGMTRGGARPAEAQELARFVQGCRELELAGVFTHLATARSAAATDAQMRCLDEWMARTAAWLPRGLLVHLASSHAALRDRHSHRGMVRVGLAWTGLVDDEWGSLPVDDRLESVVRWSTTVVQAKRVPAGTPVGYGSTWASSVDTVIALLPVGYADGFMPPADGQERRVRIQAHGVWHTAPVVGAVNMDQVTVDVGAILGACASPQGLYGAEVELLGTDRQAATHPLRVAEAVGRKPYEVLCGLSARIPRVHAGVLMIERSRRSAGVPRAAAAAPEHRE